MTANTSARLVLILVVVVLLLVSPVGGTGIGTEQVVNAHQSSSDTIHDFQGPIEHSHTLATNSPATQADSVGYLAGRVTDIEADPVGGVTVQAVSSDTVIAETTTNDNGEYTLELSAGEYRVVAQAPGGQTAFATTTVESSRTTTANLVFTSEVSVSNDRFEPNDATDTATEITEGTYSNLRIVDGERDVYAISLDQGESLTASIDFDDSTGDLDLVVATSDEEAIDSSTSASDDESVSVETAPRDGTYYIRVYGYPGSAVPYELTTRTESPPETQEPGSISGLVTDTDDTPLADATVTLRSDSGDAVATTTTGSEGAYTFSEVTPGNYDIEAEVTGETGWTTATVESASTTTANIVIIQQSTAGSLLAPSEIDVVDPGDEFQIEVALSNTGETAVAAGRLELETPPNIEIISVDGDGTSGIGSTPPSILYGFTGPIESGEILTTTITYRAATDSSAGTQEITTTAFFDGAGEVDAQTTSLTIAESIVAGFDTNSQPGIQPGEAQSAIVALNNGAIGPGEAQQIIVALNQS